MSRKPSKPETRIEDYLDVMTGGNATPPQPILRIEFYYAFMAGMAVELPQPILDDEKLLAKICGMEVEAPTYIPGIYPRLYAYMARKGGQDVQVPDPILRLERYWYDYSTGTPTPSVQEYTGAVPVTFIADGTPLIDYLISGNEEHTGTPTPQNPVMPQGTGERTGNLFDEDYPNISATTLQYRPIYVGSGDFTLSTTTPYDLSLANIFLLSGNVTSGTSTPGNGAWLNHNVTAQSVDGYVTIAYRHYRNTTSPADCKTMLNSGSTALPYEPYGYKLTISSANTTTPIYLGEVETSRGIKKMVLTGDEGWKNLTSDNTRFYLDVITPDYIRADSQITYICTHYIPYEQTTSATLVPNLNMSMSSAPAQRLYITDSNYTSVAGFKAYLAAQYAAGTPVTIWYVLATPETAVVNEPLMKIGDYADTLSMEQAGVQIPTANGSTTLDVETTVKPSEVYIKYRGEAVATLSSLPAEVSSPEETPEETEE